MAWIPITVAMVESGAWLSSGELETARTLAMNDGLGDPLPDVIAAVVGLIRGRVLACHRNVAGPEGTIPSELLSAARALFIPEMLLRVPGAQVVIDEPRQKAIERAERLLRDVAACGFTIEPPLEQPSTPPPPAQSATGGDCPINFQPFS